MLEHHLASCSERFLLRLFGQLRLSSELQHFRWGEGIENIPTLAQNKVQTEMSMVLEPIERFIVLRWYSYSHNTDYSRNEKSIKNVVKLVG